MTDKLFRERGFGAVSIADIANALGMSPANVFKHFHSKNALVDAIFLQQIRIFEQKIHLLDDSHTPYERMLDLARTLMENHHSDLNDNPYIFDMILQTAKRDLACGEYYQQLIKAQLAIIIRDGIRQGVYRKSDPMEEAGLVLQVLTTILHPVLIAREEAGILATRCRDVVGLIDRSLKYTLEK
ncbi:TetR family transcriptional regulator [Agrobacterium larrymoorei]|nr:TetR/AcrR family transcriptional regulator [Agrobacterium larrymoorei]QYA08444.1 TetR family transcriptional regulator [Agrobacterium larrymoorei]